MSHLRKALSAGGILAWVLVAIILALVLGSIRVSGSPLIPQSLGRVFATFSGLFSQFLSFAIPLIIIGLVTPAIADLARTRARGADAPRLRAAERFGLDPGLPTLLVTGGSLGALHLNDVLTSGLPAIRRAGVQILHLTGRGKDGAVRAALREAGGYGRYRVVDYLRGMEEAYAAADLVLCRSGAGTVAELCALGLPGFFVPLPIGNGEQERNAADVVAAGGAALVRDRDFDLTAFERDVLPLVGDAARLEAMAAAPSGKRE